MIHHAIEYYIIFTTLPIEFDKSYQFRAKGRQTKTKPLSSRSFSFVFIRIQLESNKFLCSPIVSRFLSNLASRRGQRERYSNELCSSIKLKFKDYRIAISDCNMHKSSRLVTAIGQRLLSI